MSMSSSTSNFFIVAATVMPVLYLALTLQGPMYQKAMDRWRSAVREGNQNRGFKSVARTLTAAIFAMGLAGIILFSILAEFLALYSLYSGRASPQTQQTVFQASALLLIATAVGPFYSFASAYVGTLVDDFRAAIKRRTTRIAAEKSRDERAVKWMKRREAEWQARQEEAEEKEQSPPEGTDTNGNNLD
jgi:MFS family permease